MRQPPRNKTSIWPPRAAAVLSLSVTDDATFAAAWPTSAILWLCMWLSDFTFLHIPKSGGSAIEAVDGTSPNLQFRVLRGPHVRLANGRQLPNLFELTGDCAGALRTSPWHYTPLEMRACGVPAARDPYPRHLQQSLGGPIVVEPAAAPGSRRVYCVVRDPTERFLSAYAFAREHGSKRRPSLPELWSYRCPSPKTGRAITRASMADELACFAREAERAVNEHQAALRALLRAASSRDGDEKSGGATSARRRYQAKVRFSDLVAHTQPQARFVDECDVVFRHEDLRVARLPQLNRLKFRANHAADLGAALNSTPEIRTILKRLYAEDETIWRNLAEGRAPTDKPRHRPLRAWERLTLQRRFPDFVRTPPSCEPPSCSCPACCGVGAMTGARCVLCHLTHAECGGPGLSARGRLARLSPALATPLCRTLPLMELSESVVTPIACSTCAACCDQPHVPATGGACTACARERCGANVSFG